MSEPFAEAVMSALVISLTLAAFFQATPAGSSRPGTVAVVTAKKAAVAGQVVNSATGEPLKKARVRLKRSDEVDFPAPDSESAITDEVGHFEFPSVYPGEYSLTAIRSGFTGSAMALDSSYSAGRKVRLVLEPGERVTDVTLRLVPHGVISGRVIDQNGDPARNVIVSALCYSYATGSKQLAAAGVSPVATNDLGEYRIFGLLPGRYYLRADAQRVGVGLAGPAAPEGQRLAPVFYPNSPGADTAIAVEVKAGSEVSNINLTLVPVRTVRVSGTIAIEPGRAAPESVQIMLTAVGVGLEAVGFADQRGNFEFRSVRPGAYLAQAMGLSGADALTASVPFAVGDSNIDGLKLILTGSAHITGTVRGEGMSITGLNYFRFTVALSPFGAAVAPSSSNREFVALRGPGSLDRQGNFSLESRTPSLVQPVIFGLPDGCYIKSALLDGKEMVDTPFAITGSAERRLDLVISDDGATVEGVVVTDKDTANGATVALIPSEPALRNSQRLVRSIESRQDGRFAFRSVPPGRYRIYAWEEVERGAWFDPDFMDRFVNAGESVMLQSKGSETVSVKLLSAWQEAAR
jgi:protocatechuate 3,4-dioxygenase beta subunit